MAGLSALIGKSALLTEDRRINGFAVFPEGDAKHVALEELSGDRRP
jgi:hypothetical protein